MTTRIAVVSLWADDVPQTAHFYRDVIGLPLLSHHSSRPHFDIGGSYLVILKGHPTPAQDAFPSRFPVIAFAVDDLEAAVELLNRHGVEMPWGVESDSDSRWVMFYDPAGNLIELAKFGR